MKEDFLIFDETGGKLYEAVRDLPVIDWHNHLPVKDLAADRKYADLTELWVASDPYKHRAMRICGVPEKKITGDVPSIEKFRAWSGVLPQLAGNPLYHWSQLELKRIFGIDEPLRPETADMIWEKANARLSEAGYTARGLLKKFNVEYAAPCASAGDDLSGFAQVPGIVPSLRGDDLFGLSSPLFSEADGLVSLRARLKDELLRFHAAGCRFADHALDAGFTYVPDDGRNDKRFAELKRGTLSGMDRNALACEVLRTLGGFYAELGWTLQLHIGALRKTSSRLRSAAGPAGGYAGIGSTCDVRSLASLLDDLESSEAGLPRVFLYTLNPVDHAMFAVLSGSFPGDGVRGKVTLGPAWWYCDHIHGMRDCFENIAAYGVLSVFPGMTTDSRSLLSFVRHEYFRRVFCGWLAEKAARDEMPSDFAVLEDLAKKVCYHNAKAIIQ
ncbi:MAG: glucuronate isomerase [Lentisphaeria bacterium]|nr:glucuronate isomerase [Lentisphaeria bacterium]